jgi:hypothetical protein
MNLLDVREYDCRYVKRTNHSTRSREVYIDHFSMIVIYSMYMYVSCPYVVTIGILIIYKNKKHT